MVFNWLSGLGFMIIRCCLADWISCMLQCVLIWLGFNLAVHHYWTLGSSCFHIFTRFLLGRQIENRSARLCLLGSACVFCLLTSLLRKEFSSLFFSHRLCLSIFFSLNLLHFLLSYLFLNLCNLLVDEALCLLLHLFSKFHRKLKRVYGCPRLQTLRLQMIRV